MTVALLNSLTLLPQDKSLSLKEKEPQRKKTKEDPRIDDFVKKIVALQSNGNILLSLGKFETEEEYNIRRTKILKHQF